MTASECLLHGAVFFFAGCMAVLRSELGGRLGSELGGCLGAPQELQPVLTKMGASASGPSAE
jgi:hypothetical protein